MMGGRIVAHVNEGVSGRDRSLSRSTTACISQLGICIFKGAFGMSLVINDSYVT